MYNNNVMLETCVAENFNLNKKQTNKKHHQLNLWDLKIVIMPVTPKSAELTRQFINIKRTKNIFLYYWQFFCSKNDDNASFTLIKWSLACHAEYIIENYKQ